MKYLDRGESVSAVQRRLIALGYEIYGAPDAELGPVTWHALGEFANEYGLRWPKVPYEDTKIPDDVLQMLYAQDNRGPSPYAKSYSITTFDLRHETNGIIPHSRIVRGRTVMRPAASITGICIHQMGMDIEPTEGQLMHAGGNHRLAKARSFREIPAHACASKDQFFSVHAELQHFLSHGHSFNRDTIALEIEGSYDEYIKDKKRDELTENTILASREALSYLVRGGIEVGMPLKYIYAHRQAHRLLSRDPGEAIWREVVMWGAETYDLEIRPRHTRGDGHAVPTTWYSKKAKE